MGFSLKSITNAVMPLNPMNVMTGAKNISDSITGSSKQDAINTLDAGQAGAANTIKSMYGDAPSQLKQGYGNATNSAKTGFAAAANDLRSGTGVAKNDLRTGMNSAMDETKKGYSEAKGYYESPEMVSSRAELYNRLLGKGGYSSDALDNMKAGAREEYGTGLRSAEQSLQQLYGDSSAQGLAGENLARAAAQLGASRANSIRDIDIGNEQLKRQEMTGAIDSLSRDAAARAGLSTDEATALSGIQERLASGTANLSSQEAQGLADLAAKEGMTVADLQAKLASGTADLTTEEATALANIFSAGASNKATMQTAKTGFMGLW